MNKKREANKVNKEKTRRDFGRIAIRVIAAILAIIMILAFAGTLIYYITVY